MFLKCMCHIGKHDFSAQSGYAEMNVQNVAVGMLRSDILHK